MVYTAPAVSSLKANSQYTITSDGSNVYAQDIDGKKVQDSELHELFNDEVMNGLVGTRPEKVTLLGDFTANDLLLLQDHVHLDVFGAKITLGADKDAIFSHAGEGTNTRVLKIKIFGGEYRGGKATRTKGRFILGSFADSEIAFARILGFVDEAMKFTRYGALGVNATKVHDNWIGESATGSSNKKGVLLQASGNYGLSDWYFERNLFINNGYFNLKLTNNCHNTHVNGNHYAGWSEETVSDPSSKTCSIIAEGDIRKLYIENGNHFEQTQLQCIKIVPASGHFSDTISIIGNNFYDSCRANTGVDATDVDTVLVDCTAGQSRHGIFALNSMTNDNATKPRYALNLLGANANYWLAHPNTIQSNAYRLAWRQTASTGAGNKWDADPLV